MAKKYPARKIKQKIKEALFILKSLDFPPQQQNERSALTLLALLSLKPDDLWENASNPLMGITLMMDFFAEYNYKHCALMRRQKFVTVIITKLINLFTCF